jgi:glycine cleavage system H protein
MSVPSDLHYTPEHEWVSVEGTLVSVGITEYAAQQLGDVVYLSLPAVGAAVTAGDPCGEVESVKSLVNAEPYTSGWMFRVRVGQDGNGDAALPTDLLSAAEYEELTKSAG